MISFVSLGTLLVACGVTPRDTLPPPAIVEQTTALVAAAWDVPPPELVLAWGRLPTLPDSLETASLRLGGSGRNGWFVLTIAPSHGRPVAITVRAGTPRRMPVAGTALVVGQQISLTDRVWEERVGWGRPSETPPSDPVGWEVRRAIAAGDVLTVPVVRAPIMVNAGDPVTFIWEHGRVRMERIANAQAPARAGELVRAQVGAIRLTGRVISPGVAVLEESP